ncbi:MAG: restriction endonuclease subunit S [Chloroflexota bacterium]
MEVKAGFKETEIGIIPEDWDLKSIDTIAKIEGGGTPSTQIDEYWDGQIPWISAGDISNAKGRYVKETEFFISELGLSNSPTKILPKDTTIIIARGATVGRMAQLGKDMAFNQTCYCLLPKDGLDKHYLYYSMLFSVNSIIAMSYGTIFGTITTNSFRDWFIPLPPLAEQEAIAEALSDADALIEALEQLLAKKRQVKQGAMQELLTGKKRVVKSGKWEVKRLGEIAEIVSGGTPSTRIAEYWNGDIDWCTPTDITSTEGKYLTHTEKRITEAGLKNSSANLLPKGALLLCSRATIGEVKIATDRICTNQGFKSLICSDQVNNEFLYYIILTLKPKLLEKGIGSTFLEISKKDTAAIEINLAPFEEQTAIAEILSDMDAEITALEAKLSKAREVKAGMMSELLTGRIRLVES